MCAGWANPSKPGGKVACADAIVVATSENSASAVIWGTRDAVEAAEDEVGNAWLAMLKADAPDARVMRKDNMA